MHPDPPSRIRVECSLLFAAVGGLVLLAGCSGPSAKVTGRATCNGKAVIGAILFSPNGDGASNTGPAVSAVLKEDGTYEVVLRSIGKHMVQVSPSDIKYPTPPGELDYPCDRAPVERDVKAGENTVNIELSPRMP